MKRVAAGAHLPTFWVFEPAKSPDDRVGYCLDNETIDNGPLGIKDSFLRLYLLTAYEFSYKCLFDIWTSHI